MSTDLIFQPITINGVTFKNRVFRSSLGGRVDYYNGAMSEARIAWDRRFARGGVAAIVSSNCAIRPDGAAVPGYAMIDDDCRVPSWRRLIREMHAHDCRYIIQLHFSGRQRDLARKEFEGVRPPGATDRPDLLYGLRSRRMTRVEIAALVEAYARAAVRARDAGADGVEIVACNGYVLHQFLSSAINDRDDEYNGDLRARARLTIEVLQAVRNAVGRDFFVSMKLSGRDEHNAYTAPFVRRVGNTLADTMQLSKWLAGGGLDAIHVSEGDSFPHPLVPAGRLPADDARHVYNALFYEGTRTPVMLLLMQIAPFRRFLEWNWGRRMAFKRGAEVLPERIEGMNQDDAAAIRRASGLPVICVGGWQTASRIRAALAAGHCDVVSIARGLLANPSLVQLYAEGREAPDRPCTYCNRCAVNALQYPLACWDESRFDTREQMFAEAYRVYDEAAVG